jgi:RNA polymerase sigma factor (sigma-70 family)
MKYASFDKEMAEDYYQEAFYIMYCKVKDGKLSKLTSKISTLLIGIGKNLILNDARRKDMVSDKDDETILDDEFERKENELESQTKQEIVRNVVRLLTEPCKTILELFYWSRLRYSEMLKKIKTFKNTNSLKAQKRKCMKRLEEKLKSAFKAADLF